MWEVVVWSCLAFLPRLLTALAIVIVFLIAANAAQRLAIRLSHARQMESELTLLFGRTAKIILIAFGLITALGTLGVDVTALVAGLGLTGFALGFALKDIISNALSGFLVLFYKPFKNGDRIVVSALEGTVSEVNLRYTVLDADDQTIFIPNANLFTNPVLVKKKVESPP
jgi:small-conductance mechanosensitive channel